MNSVYAEANSGGSTVTLHCRWVSPIGDRIARRPWYSCGCAVKYARRLADAELGWLRFHTAS